MRLRSRRVASVIAVASGVLLSIAAVAFVRPLAIVVPTAIPGVQCPNAAICVDNFTAFSEAQALYRAGYATAVAAVGPFHHEPRVVFCTTSACADMFGLGRRAALTIGIYGTVVTPRGWKPFYLAHEMIHYRQAEELGQIATMISRPRWFIEGMAYSLSGDPRHPLGPPYEQWRSQFNAWHAGIGSRDLWEAAKEVR